jgi:hypothetical protein
MPDWVADDELLYRRVPDNPQYYSLESDGLKVSRQAFSDRNMQISVDRANLCDHTPTWTQADDKTSGVVSLVAGEVRHIDDVTFNAQGRETFVYRVDVLPMPLPENPAHAEIRTDPALESKNTFRRLMTSLALLANRRGWLILPAQYRNQPDLQQ